jgi:hypothetical protein
MMLAQNLRRCAVAIAALATVWTAVACEPGRIPEYENATSQRVTVYKDGIAMFTLEPHGSTTIPMFKEDWLPNIRVVAEDGRVLLEDHITWDELKKMDYKIVITDSGALVSPTPVASPGTTPAPSLTTTPGG